jgi:hypothetical protein
MSAYSQSVRRLPFGTPFTELAWMKCKTVQSLRALGSAGFQRKHSDICQLNGDPNKTNVDQIKPYGIGKMSRLDCE